MLNVRAQILLTKRAQILFDEQFWNKLVQVAESQGTSVGEVIRRILKDKFGGEVEIEAKKKTLEEIERIRPHFKGKLDYKALINYGRKY